MDFVRLEWMVLEDGLHRCGCRGRKPGIECLAVLPFENPRQIGAKSATSQSGPQGGLLPTLICGLMFLRATYAMTPDASRSAVLESLAAKKQLASFLSIIFREGFG